MSLPYFLLQLWDYKLKEEKNIFYSIKYKATYNILFPHSFISVYVVKKEEAKSKPE